MAIYVCGYRAMQLVSDLIYMSGDTGNFDGQALIVGAALRTTGGPVLMSGVAAVAILVARTRLRADRRWPRRLVYVVEGVTLATIAIDTALAIALTSELPPLVALLTQLVLPISVITVLRRSVRAAAAPIPLSTVSTLEVAS